MRILEACPGATGSAELSEYGSQRIATDHTNYSPDEDMKIEQAKSKSKKKPRAAAHHPHHISGRYVEFDVNVMSPEEPTPSEESGDRSEGQAELDEFQDATETPSTAGGHPCDCPEGDVSGDTQDHPHPRQKLTVNTHRAQSESGEPQHYAVHEGPGRGDALPQVSGNQVGANVGDERDLQMDEHDEDRSVDESPDSDSGDGDDGQWNAVCVACLRVYSRDPDLTITLVTPEDRQGASNLVRGQEPAGATM